MLRFLFPAVAIVTMTFTTPAHLAGQASASPRSLHAALAGSWTGTLRYRDYRDSTRFVSLPTVVEGHLASDSTSVRLDFTYDDGPGKTVRSRDDFSLDAEASALTWGPVKAERAPSIFVVQQFGGADTLALVVAMDGEDDDRRARIRETLTVHRSELRILKEVQFSADGPWVFRHECLLRR